MFDGHYLIMRFIQIIIIAALEIHLILEPLIYVGLLSHSLEQGARLRFRFFGVAYLVLFKFVLIIAVTKLLVTNLNILSLWGFQLTLSKLLIIIGGIFLLLKSSFEIYEMFRDAKFSSKTTHDNLPNVNYNYIIRSIILISSVFAIESVIININLSQEINVLYAASILALIVITALFSGLLRIAKKYHNVRLFFLTFISFVGIYMLVKGMGFQLPQILLYSVFSFTILLELMKVKLDKVKNKYSISIN